MDRSPFDFDVVTGPAEEREKPPKDGLEVPEVEEPPK